MNSTKAVELKVRVTPEQVQWLRLDAEARFSGNLSAAVRRAFEDARMLRLARESYANIVFASEIGETLERPGGVPTAFELVMESGDRFDAETIEELGRLAARRWEPGS